MEFPRLIETKLSHDERGSFKKILSLELAQSSGIGSFHAVEMFTSQTKLHGIRGMHIQGEPKSSRKIIWVSRGKILDVVVNVDFGPEYGKIHKFELDENSNFALYVPASHAHGFQALSNNAVVNYLTDCEYAKDYDFGFHPESFDFKWPYAASVMSYRDSSLPPFGEFGGNR